MLLNGIGARVPLTSTDGTVVEPKPVPLPRSLASSREWTACSRAGTRLHGLLAMCLS